MNLALYLCFFFFGEESSSDWWSALYNCCDFCFPFFRRAGHEVQLGDTVDLSFPKGKYLSGFSFIVKGY